jgi:hypothetical protein
MVHGSAKKKKKQGSSKKRKPVNLQPQYASKFQKVLVSGSSVAASNVDFDDLPHPSMFPSNREETGFSIGDFHLHRYNHDRRV